jgi:hypothetical protein
LVALLSLRKDGGAIPSLIEPAGELFRVDADRARSDPNAGHDLCGDKALDSSAAYLELLGHLVKRQKAPLGVGYGHGHTLPLARGPKSVHY